MGIAAAIQLVSFGVLGAAGTALLLDLLKARLQLKNALAEWRIQKEETLHVGS